VKCLLRGHVWQLTSAQGFSFRCQRCRMLWPDKTWRT